VGEAVAEQEVLRALRLRSGLEERQQELGERDASILTALPTWARTMSGSVGSELRILSRPTSAAPSHTLAAQRWLGRESFVAGSFVALPSWLAPRSSSPGLFHRRPPLVPGMPSRSTLSKKGTFPRGFIAIATKLAAVFSAPFVRTGSPSIGVGSSAQMMFPMPRSRTQLSAASPLMHSRSGR